MFKNILTYFFISIVHGQDICTKICKSSYSLHTMDKVAELTACTRGCRLQFISFMSGREESCIADCSSAYKNVKTEADACTIGCKEQKALNSKPVFPEFSNFHDGYTFHFQLLHPIIIMKKYCFRMFKNGEDLEKQQPPSYTVERSTHDINGNGIFMHFEVFPMEDGTMESVKTSSDEQAVLPLKHYFYNMHHHASKWLNCVEGKMGIPYSTLVAVLFLSLLMVSWICCTACDDHDKEEEEDETVEKVYSFKKDGLSIRADNMLDAQVFTITKK